MFKNQVIKLNVVLCIALTSANSLYPAAQELTVRAQETYFIPFTAAMTIAQIKQALTKPTGIAADKQLLTKTLPWTFGTRCIKPLTVALENSKTCEHYTLGHHSEILLSVK